MLLLAGGWFAVASAAAVAAVAAAAAAAFGWVLLLLCWLASQCDLLALTALQGLSRLDASVFDGCITLFTAIYPDANLLWGDTVGQPRGNLRGINRTSIRCRE